MRLAAPKQRALLAILLLHANEALSSDRLIHELWGEEPPATAASALRVHVAQLRKAFAQVTAADDILVTRPSGYTLQLGPHRLDAHRFAELAAEGGRALDDARWADASRTLREALALWRGDPLADLVYEPFAQVEAGRLEELRLTTLEKRIDADLALGRHADLVAELDALVDAHPLHEGFRRQRMVALYRSGRQAEALDAYRDARRTFVEELGIEPGPALQQLERAMLRQDPALDPHAAAPTTLPAELTTFVGRDRELADLGATLRRGEVRLLTLTGAGGSGKTRLAVHAARDASSEFADGVVFVGLTGLGDASLVLRAVAQILGVPESASRPLVEMLTTHLWGKRMLFVLDNFEHVLPAALDVAALLAACPTVEVLATSRVPLGVQGEREFEVEPLEVPPPDAVFDAVVAAPAVRLFTDRAQAIRHDFAIGADSASAVAAICARLDGLPLAIELAAARTRVLSPAAMLTRLEDRLELGDSEDRPSRHRTLRTSIAWSHDLLGEQERTLFRRVAVFRGGCTLAAAEAVDTSPSETFATLSSLAQQNLVKIRWAEGGEPRFDMLETIAEFAREQLAASGELAQTRARHTAHYVELSEAAEPSLYTDERASWLPVLAAERDNIRAALSWSVDNDEAGPGLRILGALWLMYWTQFNEGIQWAERLLPLPSAAAPTRARARALFTAQLCAAGVGDPTRNKRYGMEAIAVAREAGDDRTLARALAVVAGMDPDDDAQVRAFSAEALEVGARTGDAWTYAWMNLIGAIYANHIGDPEDAQARAAQAVEAFGELGDSWSRATSTVSLGLALLQLGDPVAARDALDGSVAALLAVRDLKIASACAITVAMTERFTGNDAAAEELYEQALGLCTEAGDPANAPLALEGLAACAAGRDAERAARLLGAARALADSGLYAVIPFQEPLYETTLAALDSLDADRREELMAEGRRDAERGDVLKPEYLGAD